MSSFTIAVLHYNNHELTDKCLDCIDQQIPGLESPCGMRSSVERLLVDNGSYKPFPPREGWRIHRLEENTGNIGGQNECFKQAKKEWVLFVSNDVRMVDSSIYQLLSRAVTYDYGQIMPVVYNVDGTVQARGMVLKWPGYGVNSKTESAPYCPSICYLMKKKTWVIAGRFDERFLSSHEDIDMGMRLKDLGYFKCTVDTARVIHLSNMTLSATLRDKAKVFHEARIKLINKHFKGLDRAIRLILIRVLDFIKARLWREKLPTSEADHVWTRYGI